MTLSRLSPVLVLLLFWIAPVAQAQSTTGFTQIDVDKYICGVTTDQKAVCATQSFEKRFEAPDDLPPATAVATGTSFICALLVNGDIQCWGDDNFGALDSPSAGAPYQAISAGEAHACAIDSDNAIVCWGNEDNDRLQAPAGSFTQLSSSYTSNCAVATDGSVECWGNRAEGNLDVPTDLPAAKQVVLARHTTCALLQDGSLQCWGFPIPTPPAQGPYEKIALDYRFSGSEGALCVLDLEGRVDCRFFNPFTQALDLELQNTVPSSAGFSDLAIIDDFVCGINAQAEVECWGNENLFVANIDLVFNGDEDLPAQTTGLRAEIYSENTAELIWEGPRAAFDVAGHEIIRDGEVSAFTGNLSSYLVDDLTPGTDVQFAVRQVSVEGAIGPASETITVNTSNNSNLGGGDGDGGYQSPARPFSPANLTALVYSPNTLELLWDRPERQFEVQGYEIRRNGKLIAFTRGVSFFDEVPSTDRVYLYDVIAISNRGGNADILGISSIDVAVGSADLGQCR